MTLGDPVDGLTPIAIEAPHTQTANWPAGPLIADVLFIDSATGRHSHTGKFLIDVEPTFTRA